MRGQVVLGYQYTMAIDMWSLGCVAAELFLGLPLFPGASEHDLLSRITEMLGPPPAAVLASSKNAEKYFTVAESVVQTPQGAPSPPLLLPLRLFVSGAACRLDIGRHTIVRLRQGAVSWMG